MDNKKEITYADVLSVALKWFWVILIGMVVLGGSAFYYAKFCVTPMYKSASKYYVQASQEALKTSGSDALIGEQRGIALAQMVVVNYMEIFNTNNFAAEIEFYINGGAKEGDSSSKLEALKGLGSMSKDYSAAEIKKMVSYETVGQTSVFNVTVKGDNYKDVGKMAKCIEIIMSDYVEEKAPGSGVITVIDDSGENDEPTNNYTIIFTLAGALAGAVLALVIVYLIDANDTRIKDKNTLTELLNLPVIGAIPDVSESEHSYTAQRQ